MASAVVSAAAAGALRSRIFVATKIDAAVGAARLGGVIRGTLIVLESPLPNAFSHLGRRRRLCLSLMFDRLEVQAQVGVTMNKGADTDDDATDDHSAELENGR